MGEVVNFTNRFVSPEERLIRSSDFKFKKGLIIGPPMNLGNGSVQFDLRQIPNEALRRSVLFWDHLAWPVNGAIEVGGGAELEFLESVGFLSRPDFSGLSGEGSDIVKKSYQDCFHFLESQNPGCWAVAHGPGELDFGLSKFEFGRGAEVDLYRAVPVPDVEMPLEEVLRFKLKRADEVFAFNNAIDNFFETWVNSEDQDYKFRLAKANIEQSCADLIKVASEIRYPFRLSNWKIGYGFAPITSCTTYAALEGLNGFAAQPFLNEFLGAAAGAFHVHKTLAPTWQAINSSPFRYSVQIDSEFRKFPGS